MDKSTYTDLREHIALLLLLGFEESTQSASGDASPNAEETKKTDKKYAKETDKKDAKKTDEKDTKDKPTDKKEDGSSKGRWAIWAMYDLVLKITHVSWLTHVQQYLVKAKILRRNRILHATASLRKTQEQDQALLGAIQSEDEEPIDQ